MSSARTETHPPTRERAVVICLLGLTLGLMAAVLVIHGDQAGVDAHAYWGAVNRWLAGQDPLEQPHGFLPWLYAPWLLPVFLPWALLPWPVAWPIWRAIHLVVLALALGWAYQRRPLATAALVVVLWIPLVVTLDSGNVTLLLAMAIWAAQFAPPVAAGALWALAASMKWFPILFLGILPARARRWGLLFVALAVVLSVLMWPQTVIQIKAVLGDPRPSRVDYLLLLIAAVPWLWRHERLQAQNWAQAARGLAHDVRTTMSLWWQTWQRDRESALALARRAIRARTRSLLGFG
jgi:hypothetical protein